jgi:hypothetical protein
MSRNGWLVFSLLAALAFAGCSSSAKKPIPRVPVTGKVTLDGKPMPEGEIRLSVAGEAPSVMEVKDGAFSGEAATGENRVELAVYKEGKPTSTSPKTPTKVNSLPAKYHGPKTTLTALVSEGGANDFSFAVTSK